MTAQASETPPQAHEILAAVKAREAAVATARGTVLIRVERPGTTLPVGTLQGIVFTRAGDRLPLYEEHKVADLTGRYRWAWSPLRWSVDIDWETAAEAKESLSIVSSGEGTAAGEAWHTPFGDLTTSTPHIFSGLQICSIVTGQFSAVIQRVNNVSSAGRRMIGFRQAVGIRASRIVAIDPITQQPVRLEYTLWVAPDLGYAPLRLEVGKPNDEYPVIVWQGDDYRQDNATGVWVPYRVTYWYALPEAGTTTLPTSPRQQRMTVAVLSLELTGWTTATAK